MMLLEFKSKAQAKKAAGFSYIGAINISAKHTKAENYMEQTYTIYLAPANLSGYEVCPGRTPECSALCLNMSGRSKIEAYSHKNNIQNTRIKKTRLLFEQREFFVRWMIAEIETARAKAYQTGHRFSVRLNNTSDINPEQFYIVEDGKKINILEYFPEIQFYDYTKVATRANLTKKYSNYDLTYSYSGSNTEKCLEMLKNGVRVAMVFYPSLPEKYWGYEVVNGDLYDMRYKDPKNVIIGLKYKVVPNATLDNQIYSNKFITIV